MSFCCFCCAVAQICCAIEMVILVNMALISYFNTQLVTITTDYCKIPKNWNCIINDVLLRVMRQNGKQCRPPGVVGEALVGQLGTDA